MLRNRALFLVNQSQISLTRSLTRQVRAHPSRFPKHYQVASGGASYTEGGCIYCAAQVCVGCIILNYIINIRLHSGTNFSLILMNRSVAWGRRRKH